MTDRFDEAAREISWPTPGDPERHIRLTPHGADEVAQALRNTHNAATDAAAEAIRTNTLISGSNGPLMDMGWNAANKAGADAVLKLKVGS